jgi:hypothetical protein
MGENKSLLRKNNEEILKLKDMMEELYFLRHVAKDLQNFKEMIRLRKYD